MDGALDVSILFRVGLYLICCFNAVKESAMAILEPDPVVIRPRHAARYALVSSCDRAACCDFSEVT